MYFLIKKDYMNKSLTKVGASALTFCAVLLFAPTAFAGGSSYSFQTIPHMGIVKSGHTLQKALQINVQTYFNTTLSQIDQISIRTVKISCEGNDTLESAELSQGDKILATAKFTPSAIADHWYKAILQPQDLILDNDSAYNFDINLKAREVGEDNQVAICQAEIIDHSQMMNGTVNTRQDSGYISQNQTDHAMIVATSSANLFKDALNYRNIDWHDGFASQRPLTITGTVKRTDAGYQFTPWSSRWVSEGLHNVMNRYYGVGGG